jgi:hypothetical protein
LNEDFYNSLGDEKAAIIKTWNETPDNPWYNTSGGKGTSDKIFLLSIGEICNYFGDGTTSLIKNSSGKDGRISDGNDADRVVYCGNAEAWWWWLRSPGSYSGATALIDVNGNINVYGIDVDDAETGVRPALCLNLQSSNLHPSKNWLGLIRHWSTKYCNRRI